MVKNKKSQKSFQPLSKTHTKWNCAQCYPLYIALPKPENTALTISINQKNFEKMQKNAIFYGFLAKKVPRLIWPRSNFLPLMKHNISYFFSEFHWILTRHFFGTSERKIENDHFSEISCTSPILPGKLKIVLKVSKHLNITW